MSRQGVTINRSSVRRAWREAGGEFWLELRTKTPGDEFRWMFGQVIEELNDEEEAADAAAQGPHDSAVAQLATPSPAGIVVRVDATGADHLDNWLDRLATRLTANGLTGTLRGAPRIFLPKWASTASYTTDEYGFSQPVYRYEPTALIAWTFDHNVRITNPYKPWYVREADTERICQHLTDWTAPGGPDILLSRSSFTFQVTDPANIAPILARSVTGDGRARVFRYHTTEQRGRLARAGFDAESVLQLIAGPDSWRERLDQLRTGICTLADITNQALVRTGAGVLTHWTNPGPIQPFPGGLREVHIRDNKHLLTVYVPDAHGLQVLRDEHLDNAHDLTRWTITDLGHGRHLVEAPDLAPWYAQPEPDPDVLTQARHDFGNMILTPDLITNNPPPWPK